MFRLWIRCGWFDEGLGFAMLGLEQGEGWRMGGVGDAIDGVQKRYGWADGTDGAAEGRF